MDRDPHPTPSVSPEVVNLAEISKRQGVVFSIETAPPEDPSDARLRRLKDLILFFIGVMVFAMVLGVTASFLFFSADPEEKKVGLGLLATITAGIVGYLFGKKSG